MRTLTAASLSLLLGVAATASGRDAPAARWEPAAHVPASAELVELGRETYAKQCTACHGAEGRGDGPAAYLLYPKPRDFVAARYRLVSTWEHVPTDEDLFRAISRGMPGSAMPSWSHLPERTRWGLVHYVKSLAERPIPTAPTTAPDAEGNGGSGVIAVPPEPAYDDGARARVAELYAEACASCHGETARGDGVQEQFDEKGFPILPRDLNQGVFKGDPSPEALYRRIIAGMPGTPMPESSWAYGDDAWHLVHWLLERSSERQRAKNEMRRFRIVAPLVAALPEHPDDGAWAGAPPVNLHLMPLWWRPDRPEILTVRGLHDGKEIALLLVWQDETHDHTAIRPQDFRDAAAVQFSLDADPPFFAMGAAGSFVNIWMWKSERQADLEPAFQDLEKVYPNLGIDSYPNLLMRPVEQPARHALTLDSDPTFVTGWGAGNVVSDPTRASAAEDLHAQGFGTLRLRPGSDHAITADGIHSTDSYRVMFRRALAVEGEHAMRFVPGSPAQIAFAVWNGNAGDRDGKKSVSIWQELVLETTRSDSGERP